MVAARHMRGDQAARLLPQGRVGRQRLRFGDVERGAADTAFAQCVRERVGVDGVAAAGVDDDGVGFEFGDAFGVEQVVGGRRGRHAHGDHVGVLQHVVEGFESDDVVDAFGFDAGVAADADGFHADGLA